MGEPPIGYRPEVAFPFIDTQRGSESAELPPRRCVGGSRSLRPRPHSGNGELTGFEPMKPIVGSYTRIDW